MAKGAAVKARIPASRERQEPDAALSHVEGVAYRYVLRLPVPEDAGTVLRFLAEVSIPLRYLLLLPSDAQRGHRAYLGLGSQDVVDLPMRFASQGIRIERGEEMETHHR